MAIEIDRTSVPRTYRDYSEKVGEIGEFSENNGEVCRWGAETGAPSPIFNTKRFWVLIASFVLVMPFGCSTPDFAETGQGEDVFQPAVVDNSSRAHPGGDLCLSQAAWGAKTRAEYATTGLGFFRPAHIEVDATRFSQFAALSYAQTEPQVDPAAPKRNQGADDDGGADDLARESSNPLGRLWLLNNQFDNSFREGDVTDKTRHTHTWTFQPVVPVPLGDDWMLVNRPIITTVFETEIPTGPNDFDTEEWELGDMVVTSLLGKNIPKENELLGNGDLVLGAGPTFLFPTATEDRLGTERYSAGPAALAAYMGKKAILGGLYQHWISYTGRSGRDEVNLGNLQVFYFLNFEGGWQVGANPIIKADWEADSDDTWNVPVGLGVRRLFLLNNKHPVRLGVSFEWSAVYEETLGDRWNIRIDLTPVIPSLIKWPWLKGD